MFKIWTSYGLHYHGDDETLADEAYDKWVHYIDGDVCHEALRVTYELDNRVIASHESITFAAYAITGKAS